MVQSKWTGGEGKKCKKYEMDGIGRREEEEEERSERR